MVLITNSECKVPEGLEGTRQGTSDDCVPVLQRSDTQCCRKQLLQHRRSQAHFSAPCAPVEAQRGWGGLSCRGRGVQVGALAAPLCCIPCISRELGATFVCSSHGWIWQGRSCLNCGQIG